MENKILIVGSGAMATLFAARLSAGGIRVSILGTWREGLDAFKKNGAGITDTNGSERFFPVDTLSPDEQQDKFHYAIVLVKSWQTCQASSALANWLEPEGKCLTLQNGLGNRECLEEYLGSNRVIMGVTTIGGTLLAPGRVSAGGEGIITIEKQAGVEALIQMLNKAGFETRLVDDAKSLIWGKLVINAAINPLSAILNVKNGQLLKNADANMLMDELSLETSAVANALEIKLPYDDPAAE
ncbi:MAG: ketopantoate reductase family protein, partial [Anaerolineales bacterium]